MPHHNHDPRPGLTQALKPRLAGDVEPLPVSLDDSRLALPPKEERDYKLQSLRATLDASIGAGGANSDSDITLALDEEEAVLNTSAPT